ncbi:MAG: arsenosugar biosynthesis radical SAM (seleno)protein ArsS [Mobilitalea sp.]
MDMTMIHNQTFTDKLKHHGINTNRRKIELLQLNITKKCNQSCIHCHVNAGPAKTEEMSLTTINRILDLLASNKSIKTVDITGGAPELNSNFRYLISRLSAQKVNIIDRCNLTVLLEKGQEDTAEFLADNRVIIVASLPCYLEENVDFQRGNDVYNKSIQVLKYLNQLGYGKEGSGLLLNLVYNPLGEYLPGNQSELEADYKQILYKAHGIVFNQLFTITNMPINRYENLLKRKGKYVEYNNLLYSAFNERTAENIMCKKQVSIGWDGKLYDCDFNQAIGIAIYSDKNSIWKIEDFAEIGNIITYDSHCYGCTGGFGSSCQGKLD